MEGELPLSLGPTDERSGGASVLGLGVDDYQGLKPWQPGDSKRRLHWKAFSRGQGLLVKDFVALAGHEPLLDLALLEGDLEARRQPELAQDVGAVALDRLLAQHQPPGDLVVGREHGRVGVVEERPQRGRVGDAEIRPFQLQVRADDSLRAALNAMVQSRTGVAVRVSDGDRYEGIVTLELLSKEIS